MPDHHFSITTLDKAESIKDLAGEIMKIYKRAGADGDLIWFCDLLKLKAGELAETVRAEAAAVEQGR